MLITADDYLPIARRFEGDIPWLYLDTVNKVTIGIGHLIPTAAAVAAIPLARDGRAASDADKKTAYAAVAAPETYRPAEFRTALASATNAIGSLR